MIQLTFLYILSSLCVCVCTKNIYFKFQAVFSLNCMCASFAPFLYICRNLIYIFCIFIIKQNFDNLEILGSLYTKYIQIQCFV